MADPLPVENIDIAAVGDSFHGDMSMWGLFLQADIIVKAVMLMLVVSSVWAWAIILEKRKMLKGLNKKADEFEKAFWSGESLDKLYKDVKQNPNDPLVQTFCAGMEEWHNGVSGGIPAAENMQAGLRQRIEQLMSMTINKQMGILEKGMTFLASVGSTAPFIGLLGTVWGIMNSFTAIAGTNNTSLAVVAPGIAEALFATALGLVAAIPAVVAYNVYSNALDRYGDRLDAFVSEFSAILARHLDAQDKNRQDTNRKGV